MRCIGSDTQPAAAVAPAPSCLRAFCTNVALRSWGMTCCSPVPLGAWWAAYFENFNYITHTFLGWLMHGLSLLWPGVAWFSVAQVAVLWISAYAAVLSAMRAAQRLMLPAWCGWLAAVAYLLAWLPRD